MGKRDKTSNSELPVELMSICEKIYKHSGEVAVKVFFESNGQEIPPVKLSKVEMQFLKGGSAVEDVYRKMGGVRMASDAWMRGHMRILHHKS